MSTAAPALEVSDLRITYPARAGRGPARAVDGANLTVGQGEIVALIGESGCGKSTLARALVGLIRPTGGEIRYQGKPLTYSARALKEYRRHAQLVLQDPGGALNPRQNVYDAVAEGPGCTASRRSSTPVCTRLFRVPDCVLRSGSCTASRTRCPVVSSSASSSRALWP